MVGADSAPPEAGAELGAAAGVDAKCSWTLRVWMYLGQLPKAWSTCSSSEEESEGGSDRSVPLTLLRLRLVSSRPRQPSLLPGCRWMGSEVAISRSTGRQAGRQVVSAETHCLDILYLCCVVHSCSVSLMMALMARLHAERHFQDKLTKHRLWQL